jgi:hypothetical protein
MMDRRCLLQRLAFSKSCHFSWDTFPPIPWPMTVPCDIHQWYNDILSSVEHGSKQPRGADIKVPNASSNYEDFISIGMKKIILTGIHGQGFCCETGKKGKYMCRLVFKQGLHTWNTCPLLIIVFRLENIAKKQHADVRAYPMDEDTNAMLNAPNNALIGEFIHQHLWDPSYGSKHDMSKMLIIVKTTS